MKSLLSQRTLRVIVILPLFALAHLQAATITFDSLTRGSTLTNELQSSNILVSGNNGSGNGFQPGLVLDVVQGDLGVLDFGGSLPQAILYGIVNDQLNINFVLPSGLPAMTDFVSLRVGDGDASPESFRVSFRAFDGSLLNSQDFSTTSGPVGGGVTATFAGAGIHRIEILGTGSGTGGAVDDLTFNPVQPVPEPSTIGLLATVVLTFSAYRRRGKNA